MSEGTTETIFRVPGRNQTYNLLQILSYKNSWWLSNLTHQEFFLLNGYSTDQCYEGRRFNSYLELWKPF